MCDYCFNDEIYEFKSDKEFKDFHVELSKKIFPLSKKGLKFIEEKDDGTEKKYGKYKCKSCNSEWWFAEPNDLFKGFFLRKNDAIEIMSYYNEEKLTIKEVLIVLFVIVILLITYLS